MTVLRMPLLLATVVVGLSLAACKPGTQEQTGAPGEPASATPDEQAQTHKTATTVTRWKCGTLAVATHFDDDSLESITLETPERMFTLKSMANEDGVRFADAAGNEFWSRPGKVTLSLVGQPAMECRKDRG
ncbi:hypothetical protein [Lysobacter tyrosinilyticus]